MLHPILSCSTRLLLLSYLRIISPVCAGPAVTYKYTVPFHVTSTRLIVNNCWSSCLRRPDVSRQPNEKKNATDAMRTVQRPESSGISQRWSRQAEGGEQQQTIRKASLSSHILRLSAPSGEPSTWLHHAASKCREAGANPHNSAPTGLHSLLQSSLNQ